MRYSGLPASSAPDAPVPVTAIKPPVTGAPTPLMPDHNEVLPTFEEHGAVIDTIQSDNGREFCGRPDQHPYELFLQPEGIAHKTTRIGQPQSNGIVERLNRTLSTS